tara:strand:+ start:1393 stop:1791 length:399 start_codon:yes stop_codon:yes gene_type:complete
MDNDIRQLVRDRAGDHCKYCHLPQYAASFFTFHIEHIVARQHGGGDELSNLALACPDCNAFKGPNLSSVDPESKTIVPLFNPRQHLWDEHFLLNGATIVGQTPIGRANVRLLAMNEEGRLDMRQELLDYGDL